MDSQVVQILKEASSINLIAWIRQRIMEEKLGSQAQAVYSIRMSKRWWIHQHPSAFLAISKGMVPALGPKLRPKVDDRQVSDTLLKRLEHRMGLRSRNASKWLVHRAIDKRLWVLKANRELVRMGAMHYIIRLLQIPVHWTQLKMAIIPHTRLSIIVELALLIVKETLFKMGLASSSNIKKKMVLCEEHESQKKFKNFTTQQL